MRASTDSVVREIRDGRTPGHHVRIIAATKDIAIADVGVVVPETADQVVRAPSPNQRVVAPAAIQQVRERGVDVDTAAQDVVALIPIHCARAGEKIWDRAIYLLWCKRMTERKRAGRGTGVMRRAGEISKVDAELPALEVFIDGEHAVDNQVAAGEDIRGTAVKAHIGHAAVKTDASLQERAVEEYSAVGIRIFYVIDPITVVINVRIEAAIPFQQVVIACAAYENVVAVASDQMVRPPFAVKLIDAVVAGDRVVQFVAGTI